MAKEKQGLRIEKLENGSYHLEIEIPEDAANKIKRLLRFLMAWVLRDEKKADEG